MAVISTIRKTRLQERNRLDAEYYQTEYIEMETMLDKLDSRELGTMAFVTDGEHGSPIFDESSGIIYLSAQNVKDNFFDLLDVHYINSDIHKKNKRSELKEGNIILSIVGTVGNAAVVSRDMLPGNTDRHVATIIIGEKEISPHYVSTFLNSKYGKLQSERLSAGNVQPLLNLGNVRKIKVPILKCQQDVEKLRIGAIETQKNSQKLYEEAENLLLEELGLKNVNLEYELSFTANLSEVSRVHRVDAEHFQPKYDQIIEIARKKTEVKRLDDLVTIKRGIEPGSKAYRDEGIPFVRVSNLSIHEIVDDNQKYLEPDLYKELRSQYEPNVGELLLSKDATPGIAFLMREKQKMIISSGIMRLKSKTNINMNYLSLALNSLFAKIQIDKATGGSVINHWRPSEIRETLIPMLDEKKRDELGDLVSQSYFKGREMKQSLKKAKQMVEEKIESLSSSKL